MEQKKYADAIENKDASKALEYFNHDLEEFVLECRRLKKEYKLTEDEESRSRIRILFARMWTKFLREQPCATFYDGELHEGQKLGSSRKAAIYRGKRMREFADRYITEYRHCNQGELPTREELKHHLIAECALSGDERLKVFSKKMNDKTLNKLINIGGYQNLISRRRKPLPDMVQPSTELCTEKKMTLREVVAYLKEGIKYHDKNHKEL